MKKIAIVIISTILSMFLMAEEVIVSTIDGDVSVWNADVETTSEYKSRIGLASEIDQARLYVTEADGTVQLRSVNLESLDDVEFDAVSVEPTVDLQHYLVIQLLGDEQDGTRQVTFSSLPIYFDVEPNKTTLVEDVNLYLTSLTVTSDMSNSYLTPGESYVLETTKGNLVPLTMDEDKTSFTHTFEAGERPKALYDAVEDKLGDITDDITFGTVATEELTFELDEGDVDVIASLVSTDALFVYPGLIVDDLPLEENRYYNIEMPLAAGEYAIILTVDGNDVSYPVDVEINTLEVQSSTGIENTHVVESNGDVMALIIDFAEYDYVNNPEVKIYLHSIDDEFEEETPEGEDPESELSEG